MNALPSEMINKILSYLDRTSFLRCLRTAKMFYVFTDHLYYEKKYEEISLEEIAFYTDYSALDYKLNQITEEDFIRIYQPRVIIEGDHFHSTDRGIQKSKYELYLCTLGKLKEDQNYFEIIKKQKCNKKDVYIVEIKNIDGTLDYIDKEENYEILVGDWWRSLSMLSFIDIIILKDDPIQLKKLDEICENRFGISLLSRKININQAWITILVVFGCKKILKYIEEKYGKEKMIENLDLRTREYSLI